MDQRINNIRDKIRRNKITYSQHSLLRMGKRKIWKNDILNAVLFGELINVQEYCDGREPHFLFQESSQKPEFCVVVAESSPKITVVTVFYFDETTWEFKDKVYQRRSTL